MRTCFVCGEHILSVESTFLTDTCKVVYMYICHSIDYSLTHREREKILDKCMQSEWKTTTDTSSSTDTSLSTDTSVGSDTSLTTDTSVGSDTSLSTTDASATPYRLLYYRYYHAAIQSTLYCICQKRPSICVKRDLVLSQYKYRTVVRMRKLLQNILQIHVLPCNRSLLTHILGLFWHILGLFWIYYRYMCCAENR